MPITPLLKLAACLALVIALLVGWHELTSHYRQQGYDRAKAEDKAAADLQQERNRDLQRQAERNYVVQAGIREKFVVTTVKDLSHASDPLASCPVPAGVVSLLHDAYRCAADDTATACDPRQPVSAAR